MVTSLFDTTRDVAGFVARPLTWALRGADELLADSSRTNARHALREGERNRRIRAVMDDHPPLKELQKLA